jgi:prepilin-type N-terminal cleavage/methylation domain-containing protein
MTGRRGFTITETVVALGVLAVAVLLVAQLATWSIVERGRTEARLDATEAAANLLETARSLPWGELTPAWAEAQKVPEHLAKRLPEGAVRVRVEPEPERPRVRRVTVEVRWEAGPTAGKPVTLTALFAARSAGGGE